MSTKWKARAERAEAKVERLLRLLDERTTQLVRAMREKDPTEARCHARCSVTEPKPVDIGTLGDALDELDDLRAGIATLASAHGIADSYAPIALRRIAAEFGIDLPDGVA